MSNKGEHSTCDTVMVKDTDSPDGFKVINKCDYNEDEHDLVKPSKASAKEKAEHGKQDTKAGKKNKKDKKGKHATDEDELAALDAGETVEP